MSVTAIIHFPVSDVAKAVEGLRGQAALLEEITENTKGAGIRHHRFVAGEGELVVIDQWESAEQFHQFFQDNVKVGQVTTPSAWPVRRWSRCSPHSTPRAPCRGLGSHR
jgi:hypothetical protein